MINVVKCILNIGTAHVALEGLMGDLSFCLMGWRANREVVQSSLGSLPLN